LSAVAVRRFSYEPEPPVAAAPMVEFPTRSGAPDANPGSAPRAQAASVGVVSLRPLKVIAESFDPAHPLRILLMGEPDELPAEEYLTKVRGWFRLMKAQKP
jgi:hypothetical protein